MKRHPLLVLGIVAGMAALAALAAQKPTNLLLLQWAAKAPHETPPAAILIEMGLKDPKPTSWAGRATVKGAKVVHREGYRFRTADKLVEPDAWQASSHRALRLPPRSPQFAGLEGPATIGVVLHLADVQPDATLTLDIKEGSSQPVVVPLKEVLAGRPHPVWTDRAVVRLVSTATPVVMAKTEDDFPAAAYAPDGTLWVAYISYTLKDENRRVEQAPYKKQPDSFKSLYTPGFGDQLFVKSYRGGRWSEPIAVTGPAEDLVRCAIGAEGNGDVWVAYSANRKGHYGLFVRPISKRFNPAMVANPPPRPGPEQEVLKAGASNLTPVMCTDQNGHLRLACQNWDVSGMARIGLAVCQGGQWKAASETFVEKPGNLWYAAIASGPQGQVACAFDGYPQGDYDVSVHLLDAQGQGRTFDVAASSRFEARPSVAYDPQGRLWIAYEQGPENWGKDYGALVPNKGNPLYNERAVRVVCWQDGKLFRPVAELPTSQFKPPTIPYDPAVGNRFEKAARYSYPKIGIDGKGRVWVTYRQKFGSRYSTHPGSYWLTFARRLDGDRWSEPIEIHHSDGLQDYRPVLLPHPSGGLLVIHNTDGRYTTPEVIDNQIYMSVVNLPGEPVEPKLVPHEAGTKNAKLLEQAAQEQAAIRQMRSYRLDVDGKTYYLRRGEFHRHTEISWDGGPDGSLEDMWRYAIDAAGMDWLGNGDHDNGAGREYTWWLIQKYTDAYRVHGHFTPVFSYERSVSYPMGHRNCVFDHRGVRTLPRLAAAPGQKPVGGVNPDDTKMLYRYLKELNGVCASHTSATGMGTDWRDNDPEVEPLVEVYQGDRMSYERQGAPRAGYDPKTNQFPANVAGWYPAGFINNAHQKGYRLGFESSSDHWSTHISYAVILAEDLDREGIVAGMRKRHSYGATHNIVLDVRSGKHLMGDEFKTTGAPALQIVVHGTAPLAKVDILKDGEVVETKKPGKKDFQGNWTDPKSAAGVHYYYVRVQQSDGELAWASPMWITVGP